MKEIKDQFLSEEDIDLQNLSDEELDAVWNEWLIAAQATNEDDKHLYSHGVFICEPPWDKETLEKNHISGFKTSK